MEITTEEILKLKKDVDNLDRQNTRAELELESARKDQKEKFGFETVAEAEESLSQKMKAVQLLMNELTRDLDEIRTRFAKLLSLA